MSERFLQTTYGKFRIKIEDDRQINIQTREYTKIGTKLSVGGKNTCVFILIPLNGDTATLQNLKTKDGGCELNNQKIHGKKTVGMVNLAFTIIREISPQIKYVTLDDKSDFTCELPNNKIVGISMMLYESAFYQQSYYEKRYGAYLKNPTLQLLYQEGKKGFMKKGPANFSFNNADLNEILQPIYLNASSWQEFFAKIKNMPIICQVLFPWYRQALKLILNDISFERQEWIINLDNPQIFLVEYSQIYQGCKRKTYKAFQLTEYHKEFPYLLYEEIYNLKYK